MAPCSYGSHPLNSGGPVASLPASPVAEQHPPTPPIIECLHAISHTIFPNLPLDSCGVSDGHPLLLCAFDRHNLPVERWLINYDGMIQSTPTDCCGAAAATTSTGRKDRNSIDICSPKVRQELSRICAELAGYLDSNMDNARRNDEISYLTCRPAVHTVSNNDLVSLQLQDADGNRRTVSAAGDSLPQSLLFSFQLCSHYLRLPVFSQSVASLRINNDGSSSDSNDHSTALAMIHHDRRTNSSSPLPTDSQCQHMAEFSRLKLLFCNNRKRDFSAISPADTSALKPSTFTLQDDGKVSSSSSSSSSSPQPQPTNSQSIVSQLNGPTACSSASLCVSPKRRSILSRAIEAEFHFCGREVPYGQPATLGPNVVNPVPIRRSKPVNSSPLASPTNSSAALSGDYLKAVQSYRSKRRSSIQGSLIGSYEESILNGRLSAPPSKPIEFLCELGVLAMGKTKKTLKCPPHVIIPFSASFYEWQQQQHIEYSRSRPNSTISLPPSSPQSPNSGMTVETEMRRLSLNSSSFHLPVASLRPTECTATTMLCSERSRSASNTSAFSSIADELGTPYVGTVDLEWGLGQLNAFGYAYQTNDPELIASLPKHRSTSDPRGHWRIPPKGQLQVMVKNPSKSVVKVFLIPYDLREMPPSTRTFLRQKSFVETSSQSQTSSTDGTTPAAVEGPNGGRGPLRYAVHLQFACLPPHAKRPSDSHLDSCGSPILLSPADSILSSVSAENSDRDFSLTSTSVTPVSCVSTASSSSSSNRYYLCKSIRLVFGNRATDSGERLQIVYEMPDGRFPGGSSIPPPPAEPDRRYLPI